MNRVLMKAAMWAAESIGNGAESVGEGKTPASWKAIEVSLHTMVSSTGRGHPGDGATQSLPLKRGAVLNWLNFGLEI